MTSPVRRRLTLGALALGAVAAVGSLLMVATSSNRGGRISAWLRLNCDDGTDLCMQSDNGLFAMASGGWFGVGIGQSRQKWNWIPEAHNDFIFAIIGEEFGLIACIAIALLYIAIVVRVMVKLLEEESGFVVLAAAGLTVQFGLQALINMAVNVRLAPSKGMTLPFISYGGSSMIALSIGMGLLLAFTRRNPYLNRSPYVLRKEAR